MRSDFMFPVREAEQLITEREQTRQDADQEVRQNLALEIIADELTQIRAEMHVLRNTLVEFVARAMQTKM